MNRRPNAAVIFGQAQKGGGDGRTLVGRRDVITACGLGALAAAATGGAAVSLATLLPRASAEAGARVRAGRPSDYAVGQVDARHLSELGFWVVRDTAGFFATSARCTHLGCRLRHDAAGEGFRCMCHGSAFDTAGEVLRGPAARAMDRFPVILEAGHLVVDPTVCLRKGAGGWPRGARLPYGSTGK